MKRNIALLLALTVLAPSSAVVLTPTAVQAQQKASLRVRLTGPVISGLAPEGKADYKVDGSKRTLQVEAQANLADGTVASVLVNGQVIGTITFSGGVGKIELSTERRQSVPNVAAGTSVLVAHASGEKIVSGAF